MIDGLRVVLDSSSSLMVTYRASKRILDTSVLMSCVSRHNECILLRIIIIVLVPYGHLKSSLNDYQNGSLL
jgi:hypothetical protein